MSKSLSDDPIAKLLSPERPVKQRKRPPKELPRTKNPKPGTKGSHYGGYETDRALTEMMRLFAAAHGRDGASVGTAMRMAGYAGRAQDLVSRGNELLKDTRIQALVASYRHQTREASKVSREDVIQGFKEAIEVGKSKGEGITMVAGWREIARVCGFYEPIKHKIEINHTGEVLMKHIQGMSDAQLLEALKEQEKNEPLDAQFKVLEGPEGQHDGD